MLKDITGPRTHLSSGNILGVTRDRVKYTGVLGSHWKSLEDAFKQTLGTRRN